VEAVLLNRLRGLGGLLLRFLMALAVLAALGAGYQAIGSAVDAHFQRPPGVLVDVGGYRLRLHCTGHGGPAVILDSGLGSSSSSWRLVQPAVARDTQVCSYDRAGSGWSDDGPLPRTSGRIVTELHRLLRRARVEPPYVLVGHSFGGLNVRLFASEYRGEVAGMVLVDASHESLYTGHAGDGGKALLLPCRVVVRLGILSFLSQIHLIQTPDSGSFYRPGWCTAVFGELVSLDVSAREVAAHRHSFGHMPLIVITRDIHATSSANQSVSGPVWWKLQTDVASLSSRSLHIVAKGSGHSVPSQRPDVVVWAIRRVLSEVRTGK